MTFDEARGAVQAHLDRLYAKERESPTVLGYGWDTGQAYAPEIDWDGVMGVYLYLVDKRTGKLTPRSFPEFEAMVPGRRVGRWPADLLA